MNDPGAIGPLKPAEATACPGCAAVLPEQQGPTHAYRRSSPACWARFGEVLARGKPERRTLQSVGLHLMTLCMMLEQGAAPGEGPKLHKRMVDRPAFTWLDPPDMAGRMTASDLLAADTPAEHEVEGRAGRHRHRRQDPRPRRLGRGETPATRRTSCCGKRRGCFRPARERPSRSSPTCADRA